MTSTMVARLRRLVYGAGPVGRRARRLRPRALVLVYHRVAEPPFDPFGLAISPAAFEGHLAALRRRFHVASLDSVLDRLPHRGCPDGTVAVTFDDGYADNLHAAQPIAERHGVPVTYFVTAGPVLEGGRFWWDDLARAVARLPTGHGAELRRLHRRLMAAPPADRGREIARLLEDAGGGAEDPETGRPLTPDELRELARRPGVRVGAHSWSHPSLRSLPAKTQRHEIETTRTRLEEVTGEAVTLLAYPFGRTRDVGPVTIALAEGAGYRAAFTTAGSALTPAVARRHPHALPRLTIYDCPEGELLTRLRSALAGG